MSKVRFSYRVKEKGGKSAGLVLENDVPEFVWEDFIRTPNAERFVKKAYEGVVKKIMRELAEGVNSSKAHHLESMEYVIARDLNFTRAQIAEWCETRDWSLVAFKGDRDKAISFLKSELPKLASGGSAIDKNYRKRVAEIVMEVSDYKLDSVAEYLFSELTSPIGKEEELIWLL
jgi:hypothetical protein